MDRLLSEHLLTAVVFLPAAGAALLLLFPRSLERQAKIFALIVAAADCLVSLPLWTRFDLAQKGFQFRENADWIPALGISYSLGLDGISLVLVLLTTILTPVALLFSMTHVEKEVRGYSIAFLMLETGMLGSLVALDLALFYVFWEVMLVPMYFIIGIWGGPRRIYAAVKFFLFTMVGSLLMLVAMLVVYHLGYQQTGVLNFDLVSAAGSGLPGVLDVAVPRGGEGPWWQTQTWLFAAFALAFAI